MLPQLLNDAREIRWSESHWPHKEQCVPGRNFEPHSLFRLLLRKFQLHHRFLSSFGGMPILPVSGRTRSRSAYWRRLRFYVHKRIHVVNGAKIIEIKIFIVDHDFKFLLEKFTNCKASSEFTNPAQNVALIA